MSKDSVPLKYARSMLRVAEEQGYNITELVLALNLPFDPLDDSDPDATIPAVIYSKVYNRVMWLLQDESFGLNLKHKSPTGTFRMMSLSIIHCQNLEAAIRRGAEFTAFCQSLSGMQSVHTNPIRPDHHCVCTAARVLDFARNHVALLMDKFRRRCSSGVLKSPQLRICQRGTCVGSGQCDHHVSSLTAQRHGGNANICAVYPLRFNWIIDGSGLSRVWPSSGLTISGRNDAAGPKQPTGTMAGAVWLCCHFDYVVTTHIYR